MDPFQEKLLQVLSDIKDELVSANSLRDGNQQMTIELGDDTKSMMMEFLVDHSKGIQSAIREQTAVLKNQA